MRLNVIGAVGVVVGMGVAAGAARGATIDTGPFGGTINSWGEQFNEVFGQTFVVPAVNSVLTDFTFHLFRLPTISVGPSVFRYQLMAWDGTQATGNVLYESPTFTVTSQVASGFTAPVGALELVSGGTYIAFLNVDGVTDGLADAGGMNTVGGDTYASGTFYRRTDGSPAALTTFGWQAFNADAQFVANFVPEPTSATLAALAAATLLRRRRA